MQTETITPVATLERILGIGGGLLARNAVLNFTCAAVPLAIGIMSIPYVIHRLAVDRFGILSLLDNRGALQFPGLGPETRAFFCPISKYQGGPISTCCPWAGKARNQSSIA